MVAPVTGPFFLTEVRKGPPNKFGFAPDWSQKYRVWYRQKPPYDLSLGFEFGLRQVLASSDNWEQSTDYAKAPVFYTTNQDWANNKAYADLVSNLSETSLWAVNIAEGKKSMAMIESRLLQLGKMARALRSRDPRKIEKAFHSNRLEVLQKIRKPRKGRNPRKAAKNFGNTWLEYHFGWEPLVKDIGAGITSLCRPIPLKRIHGKGKSVEDWVVTGGGSYWERSTYHCESSSRMRAKVRCDNPNLYMAQQLGFVNPLSVAWELVPFSFVVDWFANVGQVLASYSDFAGVSLVDPTTSTFQTTTRLTQTYLGYVSNHRSTYVYRHLYIPRPVLHITPWKGISPIRALTACSLLLQALK